VALVEGDPPTWATNPGAWRVMRDLGLDLAEIRTFFVQEQDQSFVLIKVPAGATAAWAEALGVPARRCYLSDRSLFENAERTGRPPSEIVKAKIPDSGSVMAGDFGEILTALFLASQRHPIEVHDPKKWRLKQDRTKPAPYSDVVQFVLPQWPAPSSDDELICAEVKTKSTGGDSTPVASAIADSRKDREGRLIKTLVWLKERALGEDLGSVDLDQIERFIRATDFPPATHEFFAVAVISSNLLEDEIDSAEPLADDECTLVILSVPDLKANYEALYAAIVASVDPETES
jgi:hypothetical protein